MQPLQKRYYKGAEAMKKPRVGDNPLLPFIQNSRQAEKKAGPQAKRKAKPQAEKKAGPQADLQAGAVKERVQRGTRPGLLEESRTRRTYWLTGADIKKIEQLAREAGLPHYQIITAAVSLLYEYVFGPEGGGKDEG